jgi:hypothetical protein
MAQSPPAASPWRILPESRRFLKRGLTLFLRQPLRRLPYLKAEKPRILRVSCPHQLTLW